MLSRSKTGLMPSYMDKNINTRSSIGLVNLKTLEMNCTDMRQNKEIKKKNKGKILFMEENDENKENYKENKENYESRAIM